MAKTKVAINGFGRIGRITFRILQQNPNLEVVAINDLTDNATLAHLLKYDSAQGRFNGTVEHTDDAIIVNGISISTTKEPDPAKLPWTQLGVDVVIESTGRFTNKEALSKHIEAGCKKVILSAPGGGDIKTVVLGVNQNEVTEIDNILSNASCTTNCLAPMVKVLNDKLGVEKGFMTTTHAYTSDQKIQDAPHKDLRRARAAATNIIPTSTGAAKAIGLVIPELKGKLDGVAMRVPTITGSVTEFTAIVKKEASADQINAWLKEAAEGELKGILEYSEDALVSSDIIGNSHSCILDSGLTMTSGTMVRVTGWYDNEFGYSSRLAQLVEFVASK